MDSARTDKAQDNSPELLPAYEDTQRWWQALFLTAAFKYSAISRHRHLTERDIHALPSGDDSAATAQHLLSRLDRVQRKGRHDVVKAFAGWVYRRMWVWTAAYALGTLALAFTPLMTRVIVRFLKDHQAGVETVLWPALTCSIVLPIMFWLANVGAQAEYAATYRVGSAIGAACIFGVVSRTAQIRDSARLQWSDGRLLNLVTGDTTRLTDLVATHNEVLVNLLASTAVAVLLIVSLGASALVGLLVVCVGCAVQISLGKYITRARMTATGLADLRMRKTHEILSNLTQIKLQGWTGPVIAQIQDLRRHEIRALCTRKILAAFDYSLSQGVPALALAAAFATRSHTGRVESANLFSAFRSCCRTELRLTSSVLFRLLILPLYKFSQSFAKGAS